MEIGINYGQQTQGGTIDTTQVTADLRNLYEMGIRRIRVAMSGYHQSTTVNHSKTIATIAKSIGHYVVWGVGKKDDFTSDSAIDDYLNFARYKDEYVKTDGFIDFAASIGIDEVCLGNELEAWSPVGTELTAAQIHPLVLDLATTIKQTKSNFTGLLNIGVSQDYDGSYASGGIGDLDLFDYHAYGNLGGTPTPEQRRTKFGQQIDYVYSTYGLFGYIGEWNLHQTWGSMYSLFRTDSRLYHQELQKWLDLLVTSNMPYTYFFCFRWDQQGDQFSLQKSNGYTHPFLLDLSRIANGSNSRSVKYLDNSSGGWA